MIVDIYTHILPDRFFREMSRVSPKLENIGARLRGVKKLFDLDLRFHEMDELGDDYRQIISLPNPPLEEIAQGETANQLARVANDAMAELVAKHPKRFPAFVAAVSLDDVDSRMREAERAIKMGARGIQIFTNIAGHPLDEPRFRPVFAAMAAYDLPIWLHPARTAAMPDYASEQKSRFEMWWCFGWPYETSVAMAGWCSPACSTAIPTQDHHASSRRRHDPVLRRPHRRRHGGARLAHLGRGLFEGAVVAEAAASRLLPRVLRRHRAVRRHLRAALRARFLRRRPVVFATDAPLGPIPKTSRRSMGSSSTPRRDRRSCGEMPRGF